MTPFEHAAIILNPAAKHGRVGNMVGAVRKLFDGKIDYELHITEAPWHAQAIARQAVAAGADLIVAAGGDGTAHEVANGIIAQGGGATLGVLPMGSGNDYRRTLGISANLAHAAEQLLRGTTKRVDVGACNGKLFTNSVGIGLDGRVAHRAAELKVERGLDGLRLYMAALMDIISHDFHGYDVRVVLDDEPEIEGAYLLMAITNGFSYGGGFLITPQAINGDGLFDYCLIEDMSRADAMWRIPLVVRGNHNWMKKAHTGRAKHIRVVSDSEMPAQIDGEPYSARQFDIAMLPGLLVAVVGDGKVA